MITLDAGQLIVGFVVAMGIPGAIMALIVWRIERQFVARELETEKREDARKELMLQIIQGTNAAIALGEATAKAVQRIPDAHCNGDMHAALDYAMEIKRQQKDFLSKHGVHAIWDI